MNPARQLRSLTTRGKLIHAYVTAKTHAVPGPTALMIETTVRCNLLCPMCPRTGADYPNEDLPDALLWPLIEDFARLGGDHVYLYGLGEPFLDGRITDLLAACRRLGVATVLSSNGTLLNAERRARLLDAGGADHLIVGIDGVTAETYARYRTGGQLHKVVANVQALAMEKRLRKSAMVLVVQLIRMRHNAHEVDAFMRFWSAVPGVDEVRVKTEDIGLPEHRVVEPDGHLRQNPCHLLWRGPLLVRWDGRVYPCYHIAGNGEPIGDLHTTSLAALWDSEPMRRLRGLHVAGRSAEHPQCATCPAIRPRQPFVVGAMALRGTTVRRIVPWFEKAAARVPWAFSERRLSAD